MSAFLPHPAAALRDALGDCAFANAFAWEADRDGGSPPTLTCARLVLDSAPLREADAATALKVLDAWAEDFSAASGFVLRKLFVDPSDGCGGGASIDAGLAAEAVGSFLDAFPDGVVDRNGRSSAPRFSLWLGCRYDFDRDVAVGYNRYDATTQGLAARLEAAARKWKEEAAGVFEGVQLEASVDISARSGHERLELLIAGRPTD